MTKEIEINQCQHIPAYKYTGLYAYRLIRDSQGFKNLEEAFEFALAHALKLADAGNACEFVIAKNKQTNDGNDKIIYRGKVLKSKIIYSILDNNKVNKVVYRKSNKNTNNINSTTMNSSEKFTEQEMKFLGLSVEAAKKIATKCVECVYDNIDKGDTAVSKAVDKISKGLVIISLKNKAGKQTEDHVCLQQWDLYAKTHCGKFLELPADSKKYNRINGTIKTENLEEKIIEVYTKGNELLKRMSDSDSIKQSATDVHKEIKNAKESKAKSQPCNTNTVDNTSAQSKQVFVNANELVETVARTIVAYNNISNASLSILGVESLDNLIESKSMGLLSASIEENKITISCANSESTVIITTDNSEDSLYNDLYNAVAEQLIEMSFVDYSTIASIVDMKTLACLHKTLLTRYAASTENDVAPYEETVDDSSMKHKQFIDDAPIKDAEESVPMYYVNSSFSIPQYTLKSHNAMHDNISVPTQQIRKAS